MRHIYQGFLDYAAQIGLSSLEVHDIWELSHPHVTTPSKFDHEVMQPFFAWMPTECICKIFERTTQFMRIPSSTYHCKSNHSANPAANIYCWGEADATDTIFSDTPAVMLDSVLFGKIGAGVALTFRKLVGAPMPRQHDT